MKRKIKPQLLTGTDPILELLIRSICEFYPNDPSMPQVEITYLPGLQMYWVGVRRFKEVFGKAPFTVMSVKNESLVEALNEFSRLWRNKLQPKYNTTATEEFLKKGLF